MNKISKLVLTMLPLCLATSVAQAGAICLPVGMSLAAIDHNITSLTQEIAAAPANSPVVQSDMTALAGCINSASTVQYTNNLKPYIDLTSQPLILPPLFVPFKSSASSYSSAAPAGPASAGLSATNSLHQASYFQSNAKPATNKPKSTFSWLD